VCTPSFRDHRLPERIPGGEVTTPPPSGATVLRIASGVLKRAIAGIATVLAIAATLALVFHEDIDREFGESAPATRPWSAREIEAWLPPQYEEQARKEAGHRTKVVGVRCETHESLPGAQSILLDAFVCDVRSVTAGQAEFTKHLRGFNGVRATDGGVETEPTLLQIDCLEDR
jgi:hypothetical protein